MPPWAGCVRAAALLLLIVSGCGPAPAPLVGPEPPPPPPPASAPASAPTRRGEIRRAELNAFLDRGMPAFIHDVVVDRYPRRRAARFRGWRIVEFFPGDPRFTGAGIQPGDVVVRVNGRAIERPDQFVQLWSTMRRAAELTVELERAGTTRLLRWRIVE